MKSEHWNSSEGWTTVNAYGELARELWRAADERRLQAIDEADAYFDELGLRVQRRVDELFPLFAGEAPRGETRRHHDLRFRRATKQAEEMAYQELIFSQSVVAEVEEREFVPSVVLSADPTASSFTGPRVDYAYGLHHVA